VLRMKRHNAKAIVNLTYINEGATILTQAYETGLTTQWLMGSASKSPKFIELAEGAAEGVIGTYPAVSQDTPEYQAYQAAWDKKYPGKKTPIFGEYNYDMVKLTALALSTAASYHADDIRTQLMAQSQGFVGATGDKSFDENGDVGATYRRWTVKDGSIIDYK